MTVDCKNLIIDLSRYQYLIPYCLKNKNSKIALRTGNFSFQVNQAKSVQGARLYIDIGVHLALNKFEYQGFVY